MEGKWLTLVFGLGCIMLLAAIGIVFSGWRGDLITNLLIVIFILGLLVIIFILGVLVIMAIVNKDKRRWIALVIAAILLLGFSIVDIVGIGLVTAPVALILTGFALWKLTHVRIKTA